MRFLELKENRSQSITQEQAFQMLRKCSTATRATPIYRGLKSKEEHIWIEPQNFIRKSRNTVNYHTLLVDNMASWAKFPKRSQSIICTTFMDKAKRYGTVYRVLPMNGSTIGICSSDDWWDSFHNLDQLNLNVDEFNNELIQMFDVVLNDTPDNDSWEMLNDWIDMVDEKISESPDTYENFSGFLTKDGTATVRETINQLLEPKSNGFELTKIENFHTESAIEVWTDGPSLLIDNLVYDDFIAAYLDTIQI